MHILLTVIVASGLLADAQRIPFEIHNQSSEPIEIWAKPAEVARWPAKRTIPPGGTHRFRYSDGAGLVDVFVTYRSKSGGAYMGRYAQLDLASVSAASMRSDGVVYDRVRASLVQQWERDANARWVRVRPREVWKCFWTVKGKQGTVYLTLPQDDQWLDHKPDPAPYPPDPYPAPPPPAPMPEPMPKPMPSLAPR